VAVLPASPAFTPPLKVTMIPVTRCFLFVTGSTAVIVTSGGGVLVGVGVGVGVGTVTAIVAWAAGGIGWTRPRLSVATLENP
jgi:hypothetical protein